MIKILHPNNPLFAYLITGNNYIYLFYTNTTNSIQRTKLIEKYIIDQINGYLAPCAPPYHCMSSQNPSSIICSKSGNYLYVNYLNKNDVNDFSAYIINQITGDLSTIIEPIYQ